jgi:hypothetical protein
MYANSIVAARLESARDHVPRLAISSNSNPMTLDHLGEFLVGFCSLPLQRRAQANNKTKESLKK